MISSADFLTSLQRTSTTLKKVPDDEIKITPQFESCFDLITLNMPHDVVSGTVCEGKKHLCLGALSATRDEDMLRLHNITTVVSVQMQPYLTLKVYNTFGTPSWTMQTKI